jgi:hypothetical protein
LSKSRLTADQADRIGRRLLPLGSQLYVYAELMKTRGFTSFYPSVRFHESFADSAEELKFHRLLMIEAARTKIARPDPWKNPDERLIFYENSLLAEAQKLLLEYNNHVPFSEVDKVYPDQPWRTKYSPCLRREEECKWTRRDYYAASDLNWRAEKNVLRQAELAAHATGLSQSFDSISTNLVNGRFEFYRAVMARDAGRLGFAFDEEQSMKYYPIFSKKINEYWSISWALERNGDMRLGTRRGWFYFDLELRSLRIKKKRVDVLGGGLEDGEVLRLRHDVLVPGFEWHYGLWHSLDEIEITVRAHLSLYELIANDVEAAVCDALEG